MIQPAETDARPSPKAERILEVAAEVFAERGYHRATLDEIVSRAETGKGTVYHYFPSKEALFLAVIADREAALLRALEAAAGGGDTPAPPPVDAPALRPRLEAVARAYFRFFREQADLWRVLHHEFKQAHPEAAEAWRERVRARHQRVAGLLEGLLREGQARGEVRAGLDVAREARLLYGALFGNMLLGVGAGEETGLAPALVRTVIEGLGG